MSDQPISIMVVDDSALMRNLVSRIFNSTPGFKVAATAMNGVFALRKLPQALPDLIVLDLEMPEMNGLEFLAERRRRGIDIPVIILSSLAERGAKITMEALALGASDFVLKPGGVTTTQEMKGTAQELIELARVYGQRKRAPSYQPTQEPLKPEEEPAAVEYIEESRRAPAPPTPRHETPRRPPGPIEIVAIGISTGGPNALREMLPAIDASFPAPIVIVQHMPAGFTGEFAESLDHICPLEVREAKNGDVILPGRIFIAPGDSHITVEPKPLAKAVKLTNDPPMSGHRPSADVLFSSVAKVYGNRSLAVIMTGMGRDGAVEIGSIYREGGITLAQDEESSVVFGMPRAAIEAGVITSVVPLSEMAQTINRLGREHPPQ